MFTLPLRDVASTLLLAVRVKLSLATNCMVWAANKSRELLQAEIATGPERANALSSLLALMFTLPLRDVASTLLLAVRVKLSLATNCMVWAANKSRELLQAEIATGPERANALSSLLALMFTLSLSDVTSTLLLAVRVKLLLATSCIVWAANKSRELLHAEIATGPVMENALSCLCALILTSPVIDVASTSLLALKTVLHAEAK